MPAAALVCSCAVYGMGLVNRFVFTLYDVKPYDTPLKASLNYVQYQYSRWHITPRSLLRHSHMRTCAGLKCTRRSKRRFRRAPRKRPSTRRLLPARPPLCPTRVAECFEGGQPALTHLGQGAHPAVPNSWVLIQPHIGHVLAHWWPLAELLHLVVAPVAVMRYLSFVAPPKTAMAVLVYKQITSSASAPLVKVLAFRISANWSGVGGAPRVAMPRSLRRSAGSSIAWRPASWRASRRCTR